MCSLVTWQNNSTSKKATSRYTRSLRLTVGELPQAAPHPAWGIDPGVNFGLTVIEGLDVHVYHGALKSNRTAGVYGWLAHNFLDEMIRRYNHKNARLVIEGAAYGAPFRQVELAEIRGGFFLAGVAASHRFDEVVIKPPATIRKNVFNSGKIQAGDEWPLLNHNGADSLAMALFAAELSC